MNIYIIAMGHRMPNWVDEAYSDYAKRLPPQFKLILREIPLLKRSKSCDLNKIREQEGEKMLAALPSQSQVIAFDLKGQHYDTEHFSARLKAFYEQSIDLSFLIGGPEGLAVSCLARADQHYSLSSLTFSHCLVRAIVAEQLYRAWTLISGHPYHR